MSNRRLRNLNFKSLPILASLLSLSIGISSGASFADDTVMTDMPDDAGNSAQAASSPSPVNAAPAAQPKASAQAPAAPPAIQVSPPTAAATPAPSPVSKTVTVNIPQKPSTGKGGLTSANGKVFVKPVIKQGIGNPGNDDVLKEVFALTGKPRTQESLDQIFNLEKEGQAALDKSDFLKALLKFQDMYALCKEVKYGDGEGRALERMATIYLNKGEKPRAKSLVENSMEVLSSTEDKKSLGRTRVTAAQCYLALDNPLWALRQLQEAMKDFSSSAVTDSDEAARAMLLAAELAVKVDQPKEAVKFYKSAALYFGQAGNHGMEVNLHNTAAGMLQEMSLYAAALEEAQKAVAVARAAKEDSMTAAALTQLASCQYGLCEYMNARKSLEEVQFLKLDKQPPLALAVVTEAYGHALAATGSQDHAKNCLDKAWSILKDGAPAIHKAQVLNALGVLNSLRGNYTLAIEQLRQASDSQSVVGRAVKNMA